MCVCQIFCPFFFPLVSYFNPAHITKKYYYRIVRKVDRAKKISHLLNMAKYFAAYGSSSGTRVLKVGIECQILELFDNRSKEHCSHCRHSAAITMSALSINLDLKPCL